MVHVTSLLVPDNQCWTLLLDFANAFNNIDRNTMFKEFRPHLPNMSTWVESCYSGQPLLHLGNNTIHSCSRVQLGDPLGPLGFSLTLNPIVERIRAAVPSLTLNAWYLDDGTLSGPPDALLAALNIVENDGPPIGLHLNRKSLSCSFPCPLMPPAPPT